jgi:hypothetical protein
VSFASLAQPSVGPLVDRFATADHVTLLVGAGASMEADLPSWPDLVSKLLMTVADSRDELATPATKRNWVQQTLERDDLLGAGAVVEVMAVRSLDELVPEQLYGAEGPSGFAPGEIAHQVAYLRSCFGPSLEILTTNYDDLLEEALIAGGVPRGQIRSYIVNRTLEQRAPDTTGVVHLHGLAGRAGPPKKIVLTEEQYHRMQRGDSWQETLVTERLENSVCLFVGMSLADPNLIRYLYGYEKSDAKQHAAIFVRQGEPSCPPEVRAMREEATAKRWGRCGVEAIFVDHYADAAQLLYEIGYRREAGESYQSPGSRADGLLDLVEKRLLLTEAGRAPFANRQVVLSGWLRDMLYTVIESALGDVPPADEKLALALWLMSRDGTHITGWAHSDRAHQDPATISPIEIASASDWVAIRTVCRGARVDLDRDNYASRWHFVRGLPLFVRQPSRLLIGCLTIASSKPGKESILTMMPPDRRAAVHDALLTVMRRIIDATPELPDPGAPST